MKQLRNLFNSTMKSREGISLIEVLLGAAAMGIIGTIIVTIMVNGSGLLYSQNTQINQSLSLNAVDSELHGSIEDASTIAASYTSGPSNFTSSDSTLVYQLPSITSNESIIEGKFDTVIITADSEKPYILKRYVYPDPSSIRKAENKVLVNNLSSIYFSYLDANGVAVNPTAAASVDYIVKVAEKSSYGVKENSINGRVNLKNN